MRSLLSIAAAFGLLASCASLPPNQSPVGTWAQRQTDCTPVREMVFRADATFLMTWTPFESYWDYGGTWSYDAATGELEIELRRPGNYVPPDIDLSGRATITADTMTLHDMSFGSPRHGVACPQVYTRMGATHSGG